MQLKRQQVSRSQTGASRSSYGVSTEMVMYSVKLFLGDVAVINGVRVSVDNTTILSSESPIERISAPGLTDLPETDLRASQLWSYKDRRPFMLLRHDLRCPCGSASTRASESHHSCQKCRRVWENATVEVIDGNR